MSEPSAAPAINEEKMQAFMGKVVTDFGASLSVILSYMGTKLGLYDALGASSGMTSAELAAKTGTNERYVREWLVNQAAGDYVHYDPTTAKFSLLPEQKIALTDEASPFYVAGGFYAMKAMLNAQPRILDSFKNGGGMLWGEHDPDLFVGTEKFFRPGYTGFLTASWIPALTGIEDKLKAGAKVADVGCGHGASTIIMAKTYPDSKFFGFDTHPASIETATKRSAEAGVSDRVSFTVCSASDIPTEGFDLITFFDCLHDMGDP
ncbi:MAG: class I SAM-dependent methyltransferase, partial [Acidobacteriota bacterium]